MQVTELQRFDVYVDGTLDVSPQGRENAALAASSRLAAAPEQIRKLLTAGRVRVRSNLGADLADQLVQVLLEVGVRAARAPAGQKPGTAEFPSGALPLPTKSGRFSVMKPPPESDPDEMELLDGPPPPAAQPPAAAHPPPHQAARSTARAPSQAPAPAPRATAPAPAPGPARTTATKQRDIFAPPDEETAESQLEVDADAVESVQRAAAMNKTLPPGIAKAGVATKQAPPTFRDKLHDAPPLRAAIVLAAALLVGAIPSYLYASSVDDGRITALLKEKAEAVRDNRPADSPRAAAVIERDIQTARTREETIFAILWLVLAAGASVAAYRLL